MKVVLMDIPTIPREPEAEYLDLMTEKYRLYDERLHRLIPQTPSRRSGRFFTYGLLSLASQLPDAEVSLVFYSDLQSDQRLEDELRGARVVGITGLTPAYGIMKQLLKRIRRWGPRSALLVAGGYHATSSDRAMLAEIPELDIVVRGQGELAFRQIIAGLPLEDIPGISFRRGDRVVSTPPAPIERLYPARYELLPEPHDAYNYNVFASQGCPFSCAFCANHEFWGRTKLRPIPEVCDELVHIASLLPAGSLIHFADNIFGVDRKYYAALLKAITDAKLGLLFSCDSRAGCLDENLISLMDAAGFVKVSLGFEDASPEVMRLVHKGSSIEKYIDTAALVREHSSMVIEAYWLVGLPGYTDGVREYNKATLYRLLQERVVDLVATSLKYVPLPGTEVFDHPERYGVELFEVEPEDYARHRYTFTYQLKDFSRKQLKASLIDMDRFLIDYYSTHPAEGLA